MQLWHKVIVTINNFRRGINNREVLPEFISFMKLHVHNELAGFHAAIALVVICTLNLEFIMEVFSTLTRLLACPGGAIGSVALPGYGDRRVWVQGPGWPNHLCQVIVAYALRLNSRAGTEVRWCPL